jgi:PAS domain-containing protein
MPSELHRLLKSHKFLKQALYDHGSRLSPQDALALESRMDRIFLDILQHRSDIPSVTLAQARYLLLSLADLVPDDARGEALRLACHRQLDRLQQQIAPRPAEPPMSPPLDYRYLDSLSDRAAIIDAHYRYVFTNKANADFHDESAADFVGRPSWLVTGERFFELGNKPRFDAALAGRPISYVSSHPVRDPSKLYHVNVDPIRSAAGRIMSIVVTCRDISHLPIPAELIVPLP